MSIGGPSRPSARKGSEHIGRSPSLQPHAGFPLGEGLGRDPIDPLQSDRSEARPHSET